MLGYDGVVDACPVGTRCRQTSICHEDLATARAADVRSRCVVIVGNVLLHIAWLVAVDVEAEKTDTVVGKSRGF